MRPGPSKRSDSTRRGGQPPNNRSNTPARAAGGARPGESTPSDNEITLRQLRLLLTLEAAGSVAEAARLEERTEAAVRSTLLRLAKACGETKLFTTSGGELWFTPRGEDVPRHAKAVTGLISRMADRDRLPICAAYSSVMLRLLGENTRLEDLPFPFMADADAHRAAGGMRLTRHLDQ